jgi:hypothetical protein
VPIEPPELEACMAILMSKAAGALVGLLADLSCCGAWIFYLYAS